MFFFFNDTATTEIYTLSLHDALPIWPGITGALIDLGITFPEQMIPIAIFYCAGAGLAGLGILRYQRDLPTAAA